MASGLDSSVGLTCHLESFTHAEKLNCVEGHEVLIHGRTLLLVELDQVLKSDGAGNLDWVDQASGGGGLTYQARTTASHSPLTPAADYHYSINADSATFIVNLPALSSLTDGQQIRFKLQARGNAAYDVTINRAGSDTIDGATSQTLSVTYSSITLVVGSTEWEIV